MGNNKSNSDINIDIECYIVKKKPKAGEGPKYYKDEDDWIENWIKKGKYFDPDVEKSYSIDFYKNLTIFLNAQEEELCDKLNNKYIYEFNQTKPYGIEVREENNGKISGPLFYLKSDQFGFSAPKDNKYPYDSYLQKSSYSETSKENVAKWLYKTRSLGGSFLWPMEPDGKGGYQENPQYNNARGGTKNSAGDPKYYIEDRVDLTLLEIKQVMDYIGLDHPELEGNILWNCCLPETNMIKWLRHFMNFETYVEFFKFNDFVGEKFIPYDITTKTKTYVSGKRSRTIWTGNDKDMDEEQKDMDEEQLGNMFNNVADRIKKRSKIMEDIVRRSQHEKD